MLRISIYIQCTPWIPYERFSWTCVCFVMWSLSNKQIHTHVQCMYSYEVESVSHMYIRMCWGAYSRTNALYNERKKDRRKEEQKERQSDRNGKRFKIHTNQMSQSMQANITICTNTNICARVAQKHLFTHIRQWHIHLLTFSHILTHSQIHTQLHSLILWAKRKMTVVHFHTFYR